jgi:hypothetical protein
MGERVGNCVLCDKDAAWNRPYVTPGDQLICFRCAPESLVLLYGIEQHKDEVGRFVSTTAWTKAGVSLSLYGDGLHCWSDKGQRSVPLTNDEIAFLTVSIRRGAPKPEPILDKIIEMRAAGRTRCTDCSRELDDEEVGGRPLFTGVNCVDCWKKYQAQCEAERRAGKVCRNGHPLSACHC